jgi:RTX calcium-binding nonapeptide repeat (4 copies)
MSTRSIHASAAAKTIGESREAQLPIIRKGGQVILRTGSGDDAISVSQGAPGSLDITVNGKTATLRLRPNQAFVIEAGAGNDSVKVDANVKRGVVIKAGDGDDHVSGGSGNDAIDGGAGNDDLFGNRGADRIKGDGGADTILGGPGNDYVEGGAGKDQLYGGSGANRVFQDSPTTDIMQRARSVGNEINRTGGYRFDGVNDCWGFVRRALNPTLKTLGLAELPTGDAGTPAGRRDWDRVSDWSKVPVGTPLSTHEGHAWGAQWHGGIFAGVKHGVPYIYDCSGSRDGAYLRPMPAGLFKYFYTPVARQLA